jgi:transcriptional regulator with XRE-family HTH domain
MSASQEAHLKAQVLQLREEGLTQREIADRLGYNFAIIQKLSAGTRKGQPASGDTSVLSADGTILAPPDAIAAKRAELLEGHEDTLQRLQTQFDWAEANEDEGARVELLTKLSRQMTLIRNAIAELTGVNAPKKTEVGIGIAHEERLARLAGWE